MELQKILNQKCQFGTPEQIKCLDKMRFLSGSLLFQEEVMNDSLGLIIEGGWWT